MSNPITIPQANGKAPAQGPTVRQLNSQNGLVHVQPARLEDLQPRYASQVQHSSDDPAAHGWYAGFSKCTCHPLLWPCLLKDIRPVHGLGEFIGCLGSIPCCICCPNPFKPVNQGEVGLITKFGRFVML